MSLSSYELFNIWFPALVGALVIGLVVAALWELVRRKFWLFISRFRPGVLNEVGLVSHYQSRAEAEDRHREIIEKMNIYARVLNLLVSPRLPNSGATTASDIEEQTEINPHQATSAIRMTGTSAAHGTYTISGSFENPFLPGEIIQGMDCRPINIVITSCFPDGTPEVVTRPAKRLYRKLAKGPVKRMKSSIILQASIAMDPWVLAEIVELAKQCMRKEKKCIFQFGNWAVLYYNDGEVQLHLLEEGNVPVNIEARWEDGKTGIVMCGLYLRGCQINIGTKSTSKIIERIGLATKGFGDLDEVHLPYIGFHTSIKEDSLIYAFKFLVVDGVSLILRSEASCILPPEKNPPTDLVRYAVEKRRVSSKPLFSREDTLDVLLQIASAVEHLHGEGVVHGDLKPANIVLGSFETLGNGRHILVKVTNSDDAQFIKQSFKPASGGTTRFAAPELLRWRVDMENVKLDDPEKIDVYGFGGVAHEVLTGYPVYFDPNDEEFGSDFKNKVIAGELKPSGSKVWRESGLEKRFPGELIELVEQCWELDPENRPSFSRICEVLKSCKSAEKSAVDPFKYISWTLLIVIVIIASLCRYIGDLWFA